MIYWTGKGSAKILARFSKAVFDNYQTFTHQTLLVFSLKPGEPTLLKQIPNPSLLYNEHFRLNGC
jgi:hypothetical protein